MCVCVSVHVCVGACEQVFLDAAAEQQPISNQPGWIKAGEAEALGVSGIS